MRGAFYYFFIVDLSVCISIPCISCLTLSDSLHSNHSPLKAVWDIKKTYSYSCFNERAYLMVAGIINTITDFCSLLLPAFVVIKLQMPMRQKMAVASLFLVGIMANVASALRIYYNSRQIQSNDLWDMMPCMVSGVTELGLGLVSLKKIHPSHPFALYVT